MRLSLRTPTAVVAFATFLTAPVHADSLEADALKYTNLGGYQVSDVRLKWKRKSETEGTTVKGELKLKRSQDGVTYSASGNAINKGNGINIDLNKLVNNNPKIDKLPRDGDEIWLVVKISGGDKPSCRKSNMKIIFKENVNKKYGFQTAGTTLNNNRCKRTGLVNAD